jgi:hypothetical protein
VSEYKAIAPCLKCGTTTTHRVQFTGVVEGNVFMCIGCYDLAFSEFEKKRRQFEALIAAGVPRDKANQIMIARMEQGGLQ